MKFLEKEELPHFAFQKEFLRPFADILEGYVPDGPPGDRSSAAGRQGVDVDPVVKDMVLRCVHQLVQTAAAHIRSGWKAVLSVAQIAARDPHDPTAEMGFHIVRECAQRHARHMWAVGPDAAAVTVVGLEYFHELIACLCEYAVGTAVQRPRLALGAIDTLCHAADALGAQVVEHPAFAVAGSDAAAAALDEQPLYRVWMPVLRALFEVVMHTEDLEVRTRALDAFFRTAMAQGRRFSAGLWATVLRTLVFAMFADLRDPSASRRFTTVDDLELWFSTTLIKALRHLIALFSEYYPSHLSNEMMREVLELLALCIAQPSEVLGKVGASCLHDMVRANYKQCDAEAWDLLCGTFARLFSWSQPRELFAIAGAEPETPPADDGAANGVLPASARAKAANGGADKPDYLHTTLKCVLQLLLIQTVGELFDVDVETGAREAAGAADDLYGHMSAHHLFILLDCLEQSRAFARRFNGNRRVRRRLVEMGVMPTMP
ncbi:guanine nucleotide exchange protein for ADP-robosylation factor, partial [Coemansia nantahalensis]